MNGYHDVILLNWNWFPIL